MAMRSASDPRRVYSKYGMLVVCQAGVIFTPKANATTEINVDKEVRLELLADKSGGKRRMKVMQGGSVKDPKVSEVWLEKDLYGTAKAAPAKKKSGGSKKKASKKAEVATETPAAEA